MKEADRSGSVSLRLYTETGKKTGEVATFTWKRGTTLSFLKDALKRHSRNLVLSWDSNPHGSNSGHRFNEEDIHLVSVDDLLTPADIIAIFEGRIKVVAVIYKPTENPTIEELISTSCEQDATREKVILDEPVKSLSRKFMSPPFSSGVSGQNQLRFMELMSSNKSKSQETLSSPSCSPTSSSGPKKIHWSEVARHNSVNDCWVVLNSQVFDITQYLNFHPGGKRILFSVAGTDITEKFNKYHPWVNASMILKNNFLGVVSGILPSSPKLNKILPPPSTTENVNNDAVDEPLILFSISESD